MHQIRILEFVNKSKTLWKIFFEEKEIFSIQFQFSCFLETESRKPAVREERSLNTTEDMTNLKVKAEALWM